MMQDFFSEFSAIRKPALSSPSPLAGGQEYDCSAETILPYVQEHVHVRHRSAGHRARGMWVGLQTPCDSKSKQDIRAPIRHQARFAGELQELSAVINILANR
jgi:hypothetical protein